MKTVVTGQVRRHMAQLPDGTIFTTRELLFYGLKRASLDQALSRMVKKNELERLALGVFRRYSLIPWPSAVEIAKSKAQAYKKEIVMHGADAAYQLQQQPLGNIETTFGTDGHASSFRTVSGRVHMKQVAPRQLLLSDTPVGLLIRAIVFIGKHRINWQLLNQSLSGDCRFGALERKQLRQSASLMPYWASDVLCAV